MAELAARIRQAENEVKQLVEGYSEDENDEDHNADPLNHDVEQNARAMDEGSDDDGDSDLHSADELEEKWSELEVIGPTPVVRVQC